MRVLKKTLVTLVVAARGWAEVRRKRHTAALYLVPDQKQERTPNGGIRGRKGWKERDPCVAKVLVWQSNGVESGVVYSSLVVVRVCGQRVRGRVM